MPDIIKTLGAGLCLLALLSPCTAEELPDSFEEALEIAGRLQGQNHLKKHQSRVLLPFFNDKYRAVLSDCFGSTENADDAKFDIVLVLKKTGHVSKVYRNLETNVGLCLFKILQKERFPAPRVAPYFMHIPLERIAGDVICPSHTILNEKSTPDISVAWCEVSVNGDMIFDGPYVAWWPNGRMGNAGFYVKGVPVGRWMAWYKSGALQAINHYEDGQVVERERFPDINEP